MIIYIDGIFDLFHVGHLKSFKYIKNHYTECFLLVGVISDSDATDYKRKPIISEQQRYNIVKSIRYVDDIIFPAPLIINNEFILNYKIDKVVHGFSCEEDKKKQESFFKDIINNFEEIPYNSEISTTDIIDEIKKRF
jgi:cytidyltransferase-like protein